MCCHRGPRRQPLALALGALAYKKYQERKQQQQSVPAGPTDHRLERRSSPPAYILEREANVEILKKAGIAPPSYDAVVDTGKTSYSEKRDVSSDEEAYGNDGLSDAESFFELDGEGKRHECAEMSAASEAFVRNWKENKGVDKEGVIDEKAVLSKWQQRRAEWAGRKAEKAARRADRVAMGI